MHSVLIVDDDPDYRKMLKLCLEEDHFEVREAASGYEAIVSFRKAPPDISIVDLVMPGMNGIDTVKEIKTINQDSPVIMISGCGSRPEAVRSDIFDFLQKPVNLPKLLTTLRKGLETQRIDNQLLCVASEGDMLKDYPQSMFFGKSDPTVRVHKFAALAAENSAAVLITGESGTGKGMMGRWIHQHSSRSQHAFVGINCSALQGDMLARELFGHARGSFTSADKDSDGLMDIADHGTLFLMRYAKWTCLLRRSFSRSLKKKHTGGSGKQN